jgi:hypothetical protein
LRALYKHIIEFEGKSRDRYRSPNESGTEEEEEEDRFELEELHDAPLLREADSSPQLTNFLIEPGDILNCNATRIQNTYFQAQKVKVLNVRQKSSQPDELEADINCLIAWNSEFKARPIQ